MNELVENMKILIDVLGEIGFKGYLNTLENYNIETIEELNDIFKTEISYMNE